MYKIFIVFLFFPIITFSQITIQEDNKSNAQQFTFSLSTGVTLQRGIDDGVIYSNHIGEVIETDKDKFTVFYLKGNGNYDIALNQMLNLYNQFGLLIKYRNKKKREYPFYTPFTFEDMIDPQHGFIYPTNEDGIITEDFPFLFNAEINYSVGLERMIVQKLYFHLGVTFRLLNLYNANWSSSTVSRVIFIQPNNGLWSGASNYWGGFNFGLDYEITNRIITNINFSRMFTNRPFLNKLAERNPYYTDLATEISFGMTYKF